MARDEPTEDAEPGERLAPSANEGPAWRGRRFGPYEPLAEIARGGMGAVFAARAHGGPAAGSVVALKLLRRDLTATHRRAFLREARVTSSLDHPNIVRTLDVGEAGGDVFLAMELVTGVTLAQLLARLGDRAVAPSPWVGAFIMARTARGLHAAHELRSEDGTPLDLVHRDVSPQNILLDFDGRVLLADFGIAKFAHDGTTSVDGTLKGKFSYMSPEQIRADALDRRSDVFGLGAVLYEALTGEHAFGGRGPAEIVAQVLHGGVHDPREKRPDLPELLAKVTARCLATDRADRYATVAEVAADLEVALADAPEPPAEMLAELLASLFAKERERFERVRGVAPPPPDAPVSRAAAAPVDEPSTLDSGARRPEATLPSPKAPWIERGEAKPAFIPSIRVSDAPALPWRGRITWILGAVVGVIAVSVVVLAATGNGAVRPEPSPSGQVAASPVAPPPATAPPVAADAPAVAPVPEPEVGPALPSPSALASPATPSSSAGLGPSSSARAAPRPTARARPSAAPSSNVFREW